MAFIKLRLFLASLLLGSKDFNASDLDDVVQKTYARIWPKHEHSKHETLTTLKLVLEFVRLAALEENLEDTV